MRYLIVERMHRALRLARAGFKNQRALSEIVDHQHRHHKAEPCDANRFTSEMPHVRIQRLGARHRENSGAEYHDEKARVVNQK